MLKSIELNKLDTKNRLYKIHPIAKISVLSVVSFSLILLSHVGSLLLLNSLCLGVLLFSGLKKAHIGYLLILLTMVIYGTVFSQAIFYNGVPKTLLYSVPLGWFSIDIWDEGLTYGFVASLRFTAPLMLSVVFYLTTSTEQMMSALSGLRLPYTLGFMLTTAIRFIPMLIEDYQVVRTVQKLKGYRFLWKQPVQSVKTEVKLCLPVFFHALRNAQETAQAMIGRGFVTGVKRSKKKLRFRTSDKWIIGTVVVFLFCLLLLKALYFFYIHQLFYVSELRVLYEMTRIYL